MAAEMAAEMPAEVPAEVPARPRWVTERLREVVDNNPDGEVDYDAEPAIGDDQNTQSEPRLARGLRWSDVVADMERESDGRAAA